MAKRNETIKKEGNCVGCMYYYIVTTINIIGIAGCVRYNGLRASPVFASQSNLIKLFDVVKQNIYTYKVILSFDLSKS